MYQGLKKAVGAMGARVRVGTGTRRREKIVSGVKLNVLKDSEGEYFDVTLPEVNPPDVSVLNLDAKDRHLVLLVKEPNIRPGVSGLKSRFLLGHDERHWFVAAIPESAPATTVRQAKEALKPAEVRLMESRLRSKAKSRRRNAARVRQGEWFFIPVVSVPQNALIFQNEPITRGLGKPHMCEEICRIGGEQVYVSSSHRMGITEDAFNALPEEQRKLPFRRMVRNAMVYARGTVRHPDHKTITLPGWHMVVPNTENRALAMRHVAFLD